MTAIYVNWWTEPRQERLKELWLMLPRLSATEIAVEMGAASRNAVIGKAERMGLPRRGYSAGTSPSSERRRKRLNIDSPAEPAESTPNPRPPKTSISQPWQGKANTDAHEKARETSLANVAERSESDAAKVASGVSIIDIDANQCRWPLSENVKPILDFRFCGEPVCDEKCSYCRHHFMRSMRGRGEAAE